MHAVSVGEVNLSTQLIRALEPRLPNLKIVVSTTTTTGMGGIAAKLPNHISKIYYPIDHRHMSPARWAPSGPEAIVLVEAEIWPNFLWRARDSAHTGVPGQRALIRPVLSRLPAVWVPVPAPLRRAGGRRRTERGGRRQAPPNWVAGRRQSRLSAA